MKSRQKVKAIWSSQIWVNELKTFDLRHFIFDVSNANHKKLRAYCNTDYYWFEGLKGNNWHRGGHYINPLINPNTKLQYNVQGFTDGVNVYLLREVLTDNELFERYNETQLNAMVII